MKGLDKVAIVAASELFAPLPNRIHAQLAGLLVPKNPGPGAPIYLRGEEPCGFYYVLEGRVRFGAASEDGRELTLAFAEEGSWFGEIGLFDGGARVVDAVAERDVKLLMIGRQHLLGLAQREPVILLQVIQLLSRHVRMAGELLADSAFLGLAPRLAKRLLELAELQVVAAPATASVEIKAPQDELGRMVGATRESVGKQLKAWEREGLVEVGYGKVRLNDRSGLEKIARRNL